MENSTLEETNVVQNTPTGQVETRTVTAKDNPNDFFVSKINQIIFSIILIINILIGLRFLFLLFGANRVGIVDFIFRLTDIFVAPFQGIFASQAVGESFVDVASILAIIMWSVLGWILSLVIEMFSNRTE